MNKKETVGLVSVVGLSAIIGVGLAICVSKKEGRYMTVNSLCHCSSCCSCCCKCRCHKQCTHTCHCHEMACLD